MSKPPSPAPRRTPRHVSGGAALLASGGLVAAVVGAAAYLGADPWLGPTLDRFDEATACQSMPTPELRDSCMHPPVADAAGPSRGDARPAASERAPPPGTATAAAPDGDPAHVQVKPLVR